MHGTLRSYTIGFILSLALTIEAYLLVTNHTFSSRVLLAVVLGMAIIQLLVQLFYFLHLDRIVRTPWNIIAFLFTTLVVVIVVYGSMWIMQNLDYNMTRDGVGAKDGMTPAETEQYIQDEELIDKER